MHSPNTFKLKQVAGQSEPVSNDRFLGDLNLKTGIFSVHANLVYNNIYLFYLFTSTAYPSKPKIYAWGQRQEEKNPLKPDTIINYTMNKHEK